MADSGYFDGTVFRAIDSDATSDNSPLSSALEGQIANNSHFLHRFGGGSVNRAMGAKDAFTPNSINNQSHISMVKSTIMMQPFLVTRGLKRIIVNWYGSSLFEDETLAVDVTLELVGFGEVTEEWEILSSGECQFRQIILELETPADVEFETDLILWGRSQADTDNDVSEYDQLVVTSAGGWIYTPVPPASGGLTNEHTRGVIIQIPTRSTDFSIFEYVESLYRDPNGTTPDATDPDDAQLILAHYPIQLGQVWAQEWKLGALTSRAISITVESE